METASAEQTRAGYTDRGRAWTWGFTSTQIKFLLDFDEHVGDAQGQSSRHVDQDKGVHARQQHAAQAWNDATQTTHRHTQGNKQKQD